MRKFARCLYILEVISITIILLMLFFALPIYLRDSFYKRERNIDKIDSRLIKKDSGKENIINALKEIIDPEFNRNIYDLGVVKEISIDSENNVIVVLEIYSQCPYKIELYLAVRERLRKIKGINKIRIKINNKENYSYLDVFNAIKNKQKEGDK